jgi:hypothetical protein
MRAVRQLEDGRGATGEPVRFVPDLSLDEIAHDPGLVARLSADQRRALVLRALTALAACATAPTPDTERAATVSDSERVVGIDEAARILGMSKDYLYRNWSTLAVGYKDADGHVKFALSKIQRYIRARASR